MSAGVGFAESLLTELSTLNPVNYPGMKVTQPGFLVQLLNNQTRPNVIETAGYANGHRVPSVNVRYMRRSTQGQWQSGNPDCGIDVVPAFLETSVTINQANHFGMFLGEDQIRQYEQEASTIVNNNTTGGVPMMSMVAKALFHQLQGGYLAMNSTLLTAMSTRVGRNARNSLTNTTVNFNQLGTTNLFSEGWGRIAADIEESEICGPMWMVGNGNPHIYMKQLQNSALSFNQSGLSNSNIAAGLGGNFMWDRQTASALGANTLLVAAENSVHFLEYNENVGNFAGQKGAVIDFQIVDPFMQCWTPAGMQPFRWDCTLRYNDCPTQYTGYAGTTTYQKGWHLIIYKKYDLFVTPTNAYDGADANRGQNGTLLFTITNT